MVYKMRQKAREKGKMKQTEETSHSNATHECNWLPVWKKQLLKTFGDN